MPTFPASHHLRRGRDFAAVYAGKVRSSDQTILVYGLPNGLEHNRIGLSVSKKNGNAPRRNRIKRRFREAYRLTRDELPVGLDLILIPRPGPLPSFDQLKRSLRRHVRKIATRFESTDQRPPRGTN